MKDMVFEGSFFKVLNVVDVNGMDYVRGELRLQVFDGSV